MYVLATRYTHTLQDINYGCLCYVVAEVPLGLISNEILYNFYTVQH